MPVGTYSYQRWKLLAGQDRLAEPVAPFLMNRIGVMPCDHRLVNQNVVRREHGLRPTSTLDDSRRNLRRASSRKIRCAYVPASAI